MGANAQTAVPVFTAGQVLTAQQQTEINTGIPVFATTVTRDAAFGGTGEKTLAEGQFAYIEATNTTQYYDGAAWQPVGASGLTLISTTTIGTTVSSVTVSNAFSATYDNYKIIISGGVASQTNALKLTFGATTTGYYFFQIYGKTDAATVTGENLANGAQFYIGAGTTNALQGQGEVFAPNLAKTTSVTSHYLEQIAARYVYFFGGWLNDTTQYTAFTIAPNAGTITGGTIKVYGYQNS